MKITKEARAALTGQRIKRVEAVEGKPGGANNDCLRLHLESGQTVLIDAYAMAGMEVGLGDRCE